MTILHRSGCDSRRSINDFLPPNYPLSSLLVSPFEPQSREQAAPRIMICLRLEIWAISASGQTQIAQSVVVDYALGLAPSCCQKLNSAKIEHWGQVGVVGPHQKTKSRAILA